MMAFFFSHPFLFLGQLCINRFSALVEMAAACKGTDFQIRLVVLQRLSNEGKKGLYGNSPE